jgi:hypothetical protein
MSMNLTEPSNAKLNLAEALGGASIHSGSTYCAHPVSKNYLLMDLVMHPAKRSVLMIQYYGYTLKKS